MSGRRYQPAFWGSIVASIALHITLIVPLWMLAMSSPRELVAVQSELRADELDAIEAERPEPKLGLEAPNPSSLTWIGYEQYEEHIAALAAFEQAAFAEHAGSETPDRSPSSAEPVDQFETQMQPDQATMPVEAEPVDLPEVNIIPLPVERTLGELPWVRPLIDAAEQQVVQPLDQREIVDDPSDAEEPVERPQEREQPDDPAEDRPEPSESESSEHNADTTDEQASENSTGDQPAEQADMESAATSVIDADPQHWRDGQPLAAQGVQLKPRQPHFTLLQRMTASPGNPQVVIRFGADGAPVSAAMIRSSGSASVDSSIVPSLYRWRAEGDAIDALAEGQTFDVSIRIILNRRAAAEQQE